MIFPGAADTKKEKGKNCFHTTISMLAEKQGKLNELCRRVLCSCQWAVTRLENVFYSSLLPEQCCACEKIIFISLLNIIGIAKQTSKA
jgi:hypothetical protein